MSLLDDARRLGFTPWLRADGYAECANCAASREADEDRDIVHMATCPILALPRIVAALEAAEMVTIAYEEERIMAGVVRGSQFVAALEALDTALDA